MSYGQEVSFEDSACLKETSCSLTTSYSITVTNAYLFNAGVSVSSRDLSNQLSARNTITDRADFSNSSLMSSLKAAFNAGASCSESKAIQYGVSEGFTENTASIFGYWTFIPYAIKSSTRLPESGC